MSELRFDGRVALVTGAGRGIGRAHARLLAARGCRVVVADGGFAMTGERIDDDPAAAVAAEIAADGGRAVAHRGDVVTDAAAMVACALDAFGRLDIVINNAGPVGSFGLFADGDGAAWQRVADVHYRGTVAVARAAWPQLAASGTGRLINTASAAMLGSERQTDYGSAKAAVFGLTRSLAIEGRPLGITVNCILPSGFTRMMETIPDPAMREAVRRVMGPDHVAAFVAWLAHHETTVSGEAFSVGGGRAARVVLAAGPAVKVAAGTPEEWRRDAPALLDDDGPFTRLTTMLECFATELTDIDPGIAGLIDAYLRTGLAGPDTEPG